MRTPVEIEKDIKKLNEELSRSKKFYEYKILIDEYDNRCINEMIGFFNIGKAKILLNELNKGSQLQFRRNDMGIFNVYMNPQRNRIFVSCDKDSDKDSSSLFNENSVMEFIIWHPGDWYIKTLKT